MESELTTDAPSAPSWRAPDGPTFNSPASDLNQLRNEARKIAESAPGHQVHRSVLDRARSLAGLLDFDLGLPDSADGLSYADLSVLLSQSR